jgi:putative ABC transport system permease protein
MVDRIRESWARLRGTLARGTTDAEMEEELRFHLEMAIKRNIGRGMTPAAARRQALVVFGSPDRFREEGRDEQRSRWVEDAWHDVRHALRILRGNPAFAMTAVLTLALGIGANTAIFSVLDAVLLRPLPYRDPDALVSFTPGGYDAYNGWTAGSRTLGSTGAYTYSVTNVTGGAEPVRVWGLAVTSMLLPTLGVAPYLGRGFDRSDDLPGAPPRVLLRYGFWKTHFAGDRQIVGRTIALDGFAHEVIGVLPVTLEFPPPARRSDGAMPRTADVWIGVSRLSDLHQRGGFYAVGRLSKGATAVHASAELTRASGGSAGQWVGRPADMWKESPTSGERPRVEVEVISESVIAPLRPAVLAFTVAVALVLLIACANLASLLLARLTGRRRELSVRMALGASGGRITRQMLTESAVMALAGAFMGIGIGWLMLQTLIAFAPPEIARVQDAALNTRTLAFTLSIALATTLLIGVIPALRARGRQPRERLGSTRGWTVDRNTGRVHSALLASETAFAVVLLVGGGLLIRSFAALAGVSPGFRADGLLTAEVRLPADRYQSRVSVLQFFDRLEERIGAEPAVQSVSAIDRLPYGTSWSGTSFGIVGRALPAGPERPRAYNAAARPGYFRTMGIPVLQGREFTAADASGAPPVVVIGRALADRYWPGRNPLHDRITVFGVDFEIVGVVGDVRHLGPATPVDPLIYLPHAQDVATRRLLTVVVRTSGSTEALLARLRSEIRALDAQLPVSNLRTFGALRAQRTASERFNALLVTSFATLAVLLAAVGIYGVMSFVVAQRTREIGVRMALGATRRSVLSTILRFGLKPVSTGAFSGLAIALLLSQWARSLLFGVTPTDVATYGGVLIVVAAIALIALWLPAYRATRIQPSVALASE